MGIDVVVFADDVVFVVPSEFVVVDSTSVAVIGINVVLSTVLDETVV